MYRCYDYDNNGNYNKDKMYDVRRKEGSVVGGFYHDNNNGHYNKYIFI